MLEPDVNGPVANHWELDFSCRQRLGHNHLYLRINSGGLHHAEGILEWERVEARGQVIKPFLLPK